MEEIFDLEPFNGNPNIDQDKKVSLVPAPIIGEPDLSEDLNDAYQQSKEILQIAKEGQHPRAFEVYGTLLKNMVDANKELLNIQKQMRDMDNKKKDAGGTTIDKAIFVGSTTELNKLLKGKVD